MKEKNFQNMDPERLQEIRKVRDVLDMLFWNSYPLMQLGHTKEEIRLIHKMYQPVAEGIPSKIWPDDHNYYWCRGISFESETGIFSISSSEIPDHVVSGILSIETQLEMQLYNSIFPKLFLLNKSEGEDPGLDEIAWRIFRGGIYRKQSKMGKALEGTPVVGAVLNSNKMEYFYSDETHRNEIVVHLIRRNDYILLRNITPADSPYFVWGVRDHFDKQKLAALVDARKSQAALKAFPRAV